MNDNDNVKPLKVGDVIIVNNKIVGEFKSKVVGKCIGKRLHVTSRWDTWEANCIYCSCTISERDYSEDIVNIKLAQEGD